MSKPTPIQEFTAAALAVCVGSWVALAIAVGRWWIGADEPDLGSDDEG